MTNEGPVDFKALEHEQLLAWVALPVAAKVDFFEEMIEIAYRSGALAPERLALRDAAPSSRSP